MQVCVCVRVSMSVGEGWGRGLQSHKVQCDPTTCQLIPGPHGMANLANF